MRSQASTARLTQSRPDWAPFKITCLIVLAMVLFACNSLLCRLALARSAIDWASFTFIRLASGAAVLSFLAILRRQKLSAGSWRSAWALFTYATAFSFAYVSLPAGVGAFLLFAAVQITMVVAGLVGGNRLSLLQALGMTVAIAGLANLVLPERGIAADGTSIVGSALMIGAGIAWGAYSLLGRGAALPLAATAGNFLRTVPGGIALLIAWWAAESAPTVSSQGVLYAILSGAVASGLGYTIWYAVLPALAPPVAASLQLSVPVITAVIGAVFLGEVITWRFVASSLAILAGIALIVAAPRRPAP